MATVREIQDLLSKVEITIDENDIGDAVQVLHIGEYLEKGETIEETLIKNTSKSRNMIIHWGEKNPN